MPKIKTKRAAAKRFNITGSGKLVCHRAGKRHLLTHKSRIRKRRLSKPVVVNTGVTRNLRRAMPYL
ncbi:MAG: 50S ribosomal protein L35 [Dissulfuribacterales bacterium]